MAKKKIQLSAMIFIAVFIIVSVFVFRKNGRPRDFARIRDDGVLHIVTDYNSVGYFVSGDTISGFVHDLVQLLESRVPVRIEISLEASLDKSIQGLKQGKYDIMARNIPVTSELRETLFFTEPVALNRQALIQRKKEFNGDIEPLRSHLDLAKKTLHVSASSPAILRIRNLSHEIGDTIYIKEDPTYGAEQLAMLVASKDMDYAVCDEKSAERIAGSLPEIDYYTLIGFTHIEAWAVSRKSPVLLDSLNVWIREVKESPEYSAIYRKYF
ncbi:MAG: transporter substrate-binding domain-containing protein [Prevotella sp.]|jgi:ABC-type amino acid transport substrate-binding protein|nr:transporter substrate-binding domain-containing protein [Prevotella sp.]